MFWLKRGVTGFAGGRPKAQEVVAYWPALLSREEVEPGLAVSVEAVSMHGESREITPISWLTVNGDELTVESKFSVKLQDYNIERPEFLIMKLADEQRIDVKLTGTRSK